MEGTIKEYKFILKGETVIEVYDESGGELPCSYIHLESPITEKGFHYEIMDWYSKKVKS